MDPGGPVEATSINEFFLGLNDWPAAAPTSEISGPESSGETEQDGIVYVCTEREIDITQRHEDITAIGLNAGVLWPGALIQGRTLREGALAGVPLPRSSLSISIDLAVDSPSVTVDDPTSSTIQDGIATLQRRGDTRISGDVDVLPARISFVRSEAFSYEQSMTAVKVNFSLTAAVARATLGAAFKSDRKATAKSIVVRFFQPMYSITFADEAMPTPADFVSPSVTMQDLTEQERLGTISRDNQPTYVKSVTYGRMMLFTMTSTTVSSTQELSLAIDAAATISGIEIGTTDSLTETQKSILKNSSYSMVALGGSESAALAAVRTGDFKLFFAEAPVTTAVPLSYRINDLKSRRVAALSETTRYTVRICTPQTAYRFGINLISIQELASCGPEYTNVISQILDPGSSNAPLVLFSDSLELPSAPLPLNRSTIINRQTTGGGDFSIQTILTKGSEVLISPGMTDSWAAPADQDLVTIPGSVPPRLLKGAFASLTDNGGGISGTGFIEVQASPAIDGPIIKCFYNISGTRTGFGFSLTLSSTGGHLNCTANAAPSEQTVYQFDSFQGTIDPSSGFLTGNLTRVHCATTYFGDCRGDSVKFDRQGPVITEDRPLFENDLKTSFSTPYSLPGGQDTTTFSHALSLPRLDGAGQCSAQSTYFIEKTPVFLQVRDGRRIWASLEDLEQS